MQPTRDFPMEYQQYLICWTHPKEEEETNPIDRQDVKKEYANFKKNQEDF